MSKHSWFSDIVSTHNMRFSLTHPPSGVKEEIAAWNGVWLKNTYVKEHIVVEGTNHRWFCVINPKFRSDYRILRAFSIVCTKESFSRFKKAFSMGEKKKRGVKCLYPSPGIPGAYSMNLYQGSNGGGYWHVRRSRKDKQSPSDKWTQHTDRQTSPHHNTGYKLLTIRMNSNWRRHHYSS